MTLNTFRLAAPCLLLALAAPLCHAASEKDPYMLTVWASVEFGQDGKSQSIRIIDEESMPAKFADNVKARLAAARIPAPQDAGMPATFKTGVELRFQITPNDGKPSAALKGLAMRPLPVKQYLASAPKDVDKSAGWEGDISASCTVGVDGLCHAIAVNAVAGIPDSVRRFAKASLEKWQFEPQQLNGKPIEGEFTVSIHLDTSDAMPKDFRQGRYDNIFQSAR